MSSFSYATLYMVVFLSGKGDYWPDRYMWGYVDRGKTYKKKEETASKGIPKIPLGGFTSGFSGKSASWLTPDRSPFGNTYEGVNGKRMAAFLNIGEPESGRFPSELARREVESLIMREI